MKTNKLLWGVIGFILILVAIIAGLLVVFFAPINNRINISPINQEEMIAITLEWGRLAPFPSGVENFSIETEGNLFTRSFRASFTSTSDDIQKWIDVSPGLTDATQETMSDGRQKYVIAPGGGASYAEVIIDFASNKVQVYVSWS